VAADYNDYLGEVATKLRAAGVRVEVDTSDDRMQKKIRTAQQSKVPFMLIAGGEDAEAGAVSFRFRDGRQQNGVPVDDAITIITDAIRDRVQV
jgi:threonyl-tRNA synthetase